MEQSLLLIAAWQLPQYRKIAMDFTMDDKTVSIETLVKELEHYPPQPVWLGGREG
jgi:hypothetical protein